MPNENQEMKQFLLSLITVVVLVSCHESIEQRAEREAKEFTEKYCPTPVNNFTRTDSVVFYPSTRTYHYFCTFTDKMDDPKVISENKTTINELLRQAISASTDLKAYKDADFTFAYTCHSAKDPQKVLFEVQYTPKEYK